jgi:serine/threonine protein kinase/TolB-like protein
MKDERWKNVKQIFNSALDVDSGQRALFLGEACAGDAELRAEVEKLLESYSSEFMERPIADNPSNSRLMPGTVLDRYVIVRLVGIGGMGEVYLATDTRLQRDVAIKLLNEKYENNDENVFRFIQEAKAASALNHPNILTIHEIGQTNDSHYIVSEFIDGKTLRESLSTERLELSKIFDIAVQVAGALTAAHAARIIHRDIKPENIVIRNDGYVKVLDFGLAKLLPEHTSLIGLEDKTVKQNQTAKGLILGTVNYMSPEQAKGESVDARTDIFSLGVLLYEMVTGRAPFTANSTSESFANLINRDPKPMSRYAAGVPEELQRIVSKMLRKDPDERYQTMKGLVADLKELENRITLETKLDRASPASRDETEILMQATGDIGRKTVESANDQRRRSVWKLLAFSSAIVIIAIVGLVWYLRIVSTTPEPQIKSLAVLPLKSLDSGENYIGLGIADAVIRRISQTGRLTVRPTSAIRRYLTEETDALTAAQQLNTDAVLEGSVQRADDRLRVSVNLLRVRDGMSIWSDNFDMRSADIFTVQDSVAQQVVSRLRLKLDMDQSARLNKHATSNPVAYDYYLKGIYSLDQRSWGPTAKPQAMATAELFKNAIAADPDFALAHAQLANIYAWTSTLIAPEDISWFDLAQREISRVDSLDSKLAETNIARMTLLSGSRSGYQWEAAIREGLVAEEIDPNVGHVNLADAYYHVGLEEQADREFSKALETDPTSQFIQNEYILFLNNYRRYDETAAAVRKYFPDDPMFSDYLLAKGQLDDALKAVNEEIKEFPDNPWGYGIKAMTLEKKGDHAGADTSVREAIKLLRPLELTYHHMTYQIACAYAVMGKKDEAMKWLRETAATGYPVYPVMARDAFLDPLRKEPEFIQFMSDMKLLNDKYKSEFP